MIYTIIGAFVLIGTLGILLVIGGSIGEDNAAVDCTIDVELNESDGEAL